MAWEAERYKYRKQEALKNPDTKPTEWEDILKIEKGKAPGQNDIETIRGLAEKYNDYAEKIAAENKRLVVEFNKAVAGGKQNRAETLYKKWEANYKEFKRLFGNGRNPEKEGAFSEFWRDYKSIEKANADWWKAQVQSVMDANRAEINRRIGELSKTRRRTGAQTRELAELKELREVFALGIECARD